MPLLTALLRGDYLDLCKKKKKKKTLVSHERKGRETGSDVLQGCQ